jgi:site-specific DNA-methyltransferase (adenine-specific)
MKRIPDGSVDAVICDLPYGTMKNIGGAPGWHSDNCDWDDIIPTMPLFEQYERVLRMNGVAVLFSAEPYTSHLRTFKYKNTNFEFCYPMMWKKDSAGNIMLASKAPMSYFEDINVFAKRYDSTGHHPVREYAKAVMRYCGARSCKDINAVLGHRHAEHFFYVDSTQFALCTRETYDELIRRYHIDKMEDFKSYEELLAIDARYQRTFNLPYGKQSMSNVLEFSKDTDGFHPTQKPVALIRRLVLTYTNEGDTVLDNCMGSGTTAIACIKERRHFIGFELNKEYFDKAVRRIKAEQAQLSLW